MCLTKTFTPDTMKDAYLKWKIGQVTGDQIKENKTQKTNKKLESLMAFSSDDTILLHEWYVYMYIYVYMYLGSNVWACMCLCEDINTHITHMNASIYVCMHAHLYACLFIYGISMYIFRYVYRETCVGLYIGRHVYIYIHKHITYMYAYICMYIQKYPH